MPPIPIPSDPSNMWIAAAIIVLAATFAGFLLRRVFQLLDSNSAAATTAVNNVIAHFKESSTEDRKAHQANVDRIVTGHREDIKEICVTHKEVVTELKTMKGGLESLTHAIREHAHELHDIHSHVKAKPA